MTDLRKESPSSEKMDEYWQRALKCKSVDELLDKNGPLSFLFKNTIEAMLKEEMTEHLGYPHNDARSKNTDNSRNGSSKKSLKTGSGKIEIQIPRDRKGEFAPAIVPKHQTKTSEVEKKIISMYAKGMTTSDISDHLSELYFGAEVSATFISQTTDKIIPLAKEWQSRTLDKIYPVVFFDAIHYKVREDGKIASKAVYVAMAINLEGMREVLGFYVGNTESSKFWMQVMTDISNRGVEDILIACVDGLKGFPDAIASIFPKTEVQLCIVHQIRNSLKYVGSKNQKEFASDLKTVYKANTEDLALEALKQLDEKWKSKSPIVIKSWMNNWENISRFFRLFKSLIINPM